MEIKVSYKVNMYSAKTTSSAYSLDIETLTIEFVIGSICAVLALAGYKSQMLLIFIPGLLLSIACFSLISYSIWQYITDKKLIKESSINEPD